jgi:hypothetical protein
MAIVVLYPSRTQSQFHNPVLARQLRTRRTCVEVVAGMVVVAAFVLAQFLALSARAGDTDARPEFGALPNRAIFDAAPSVPGKPVRIIPLYTSPSAI